MSPESHQQLLLDLLDREAVALAAVFAALEDEQQALHDRDAAALLDAANRKGEAIGVAARLEQERRSLLDEGFLGERSGPGIDSRFRRLRELAARCRDLNDANGALIRGQRRRVEVSLRLIRGGLDDETYAADGSRRAARSRGPLASY